MRKYSLLLLISAFVLGCNDKSTDPITETASSLTASTNKSQYSVNEKLFITIKNNRVDTVYFIHCNFRFAFFIQRKDTNNWVDDGSVAAFCNGFYPSGYTPFPPSRGYMDSLTLDKAGTYRLFFAFNSKTKPSPADSLFTNEFSVQ